jgi:hypothetical protein
VTIEENIVWCANCNRPLISEETKDHVCGHDDKENEMVVIHAIDSLLLTKPNGTKVILCEDPRGRVVVITHAL